jgi:DNA-binding transcriptional LysR family regulator
VQALTVSGLPRSVLSWQSPFANPAGRRRNTQKGRHLEKLGESESEEVVRPNKLEKKCRDVFVLKDSPPRASEPKLRPSENHLYFDAVARHGSIRKAAEALSIASSALNRRILDLEEEIGSALFERLPRGVRLTAAGEMFLTYVRWSLKELHRVEARIAQLKGEMRGTIRIAVAESVTPALLPDAISIYQKGHAGVGFHVIVDGPELLLDALVRDSVDLILTHEEPQKPAVSVLASAAHPLYALVSPSHPFAHLNSISLSDCAPFPLAMPDHTLAARAILDLALEDASLSLHPSVESDSIETLKSYARLCEAVCFSFYLKDDEETLGLVPIRLRDPRCADARIYLATRKGRVLPVAAASFTEQLTETLRSRASVRPASVA